MKTIVTLLLLLSIATSACAADSIAVGLRSGGNANRGGYFAEAFGDLYLNRLVSIGATAAYVMLDRDNVKSIKRDSSVPITALFKIHAPLPYVQPYAGLGAALVFHDQRGVKGTPVALVGADMGLGKTPFFLNVEYRRQFDDKLDFLGGGVGLKF
jgi:hypothetical protein